MTEPITLLLTRRVAADNGGTDLERAVASASLERLHVGPLSLGAIEALFEVHLHRTFARPTLLRIHATCWRRPSLSTPRSTR